MADHRRSRENWFVQLGVHGRGHDERPDGPYHARRARGALLG